MHDVYTMYQTCKKPMSFSDRAIRIKPSYGRSVSYVRFENRYVLVLMARGKFPEMKWRLYISKFQTEYSFPGVVLLN